MIFFWAGFCIYREIYSMGRWHFKTNVQENQETEEKDGPTLDDTLIVLGYPSG